MVAAAVRTRVRIVTDSTATLPADIVAELGILVVPLQVVLGERTGWEGIDILPSDVSKALEGKVAVSTNPPTSQAFTSAFTAASALGDGDGDGFGVIAAARAAAAGNTAKFVARQAEAAGCRPRPCSERAPEGFNDLAGVVRASAGRWRTCVLLPCSPVL